MKKIDLKPCPFCGRKINSNELVNCIVRVFVECPRCHASGPVRKTDNTACAAWDKRAA